MTLLAQHPPNAPEPTGYDRAHLKTYLRLVDADRDGADWEEAARLVFGAGAARGRRDLREQHRAHLARARWLVNGGYLRLARARQGTD